MFKMIIFFLFYKRTERVMKSVVMHNVIGIHGRPQKKDTEKRRGA